MGLFDKLFPKKDAHDHHGHEHFNCVICGAQLHSQAELESHRKDKHGAR